MLGTSNKESDDDGDDGNERKDRGRETPAARRRQGIKNELTQSKEVPGVRTNGPFSRTVFRRKSTSLVVRPPCLIHK
jgi:hypothetical protein